jgi:hypothetical protein
MIRDYNLNMGGIDTADKSIYHLSCSRQTTRYWKKIFFNLLDISILNAFLLYKQNTDKPLSRRDFIVSVVEDLVSDSIQEISSTPSTSSFGTESVHTLEHLPGRQERKCGVCGPTQKRGRSHYWCPGCDCGVHPACFSQLEHYSRKNKGKKRKSSDQEN